MALNSWSSCLSTYVLQPQMCITMTCTIFCGTYFLLQASWEMNATVTNTGFFHHSSLRIISALVPAFEVVTWYRNWHSLPGQDLSSTRLSWRQKAEEKKQYSPFRTLFFSQVLGVSSSSPRSAYTLVLLPALRGFPDPRKRSKSLQQTRREIVWWGDMM